MKIFIYVENEEIGELKPLARRLENRGSQVNFYALKFLDNDVQADQVLTLPHHQKVVEELFKGTGIPVRIIEDDAVVEAKAPVVPAEPTAPVLVVEAVATEDEPELPPPAETDEVVVMTISPPVEEDETPKPAIRRRAK